MEALLPSEISRLVLGYLDEQSCTAAYQTFLDTCPHLKECSEAASQGIRFSTRAAGKSLRDILNEYCLIYTIVQDRIQKLPESMASQLKTYGISLADQVKQLIDGKQMGQRFHVNITVPTQPKSSKPRLVGSGGAHTSVSSHHMVTPTSSRMRRSSHPIQEQRLTLRSQDPKEDVTASVTVQRVETTQLENLPGSTIGTQSIIGHPIRKVSHSGSRNHLSCSESAPCEQVEEENLSLLDPKTGELTSPLARLSTELSGCFRSPTREANPLPNPEKPVDSSSSVPSMLSTRQGGEASGSSGAAMGNLSSSGVLGTQNESGCGRSSLDKLLFNILSTHEASENVIFQDKSVSNISCSSVAVTARTDASFVVPPNGGGLREQSTNQCVAPAAATSSGEQERNVSCAITSPNQKMAPKSDHDAYLNTPRRSATKRKTKPTPLKMMTPLKHKTGSDSSDSADAIINPKMFYGPFLDNRELHERIAENINEIICPSNVEEGLETREVNAAEKVSDAIPSMNTDGKGQSLKDSSTQEELERVIKTVVDKTESDPLFESLLCDILGPECDEDNMMDPFPEGKSNQGGSSSGDSGPNDVRPPDGGKKDPIALLEDQNEAAVKSILEAQPLMKDSPNLKQGKTAPKRKGKRVAYSRKTRVVKGVPSSACLPNFAEHEISGRNGEQEAEGEIVAASNENVQAYGQDGGKLIILPFQDMVSPSLTCPLIIINGVPERMVPPTQSKQKQIPIAPKETVNFIPGNPPFILRQINSEDVKYVNLNANSSAEVIANSQITFPSAAADTSVNTVVVQESMLCSEHLVSAAHSIDLSDHVEALQPLVCSDSGVHVTSVPLSTEIAADKPAAAESRSTTVELRSSCARGSTPDVVTARPTRSATEGRLKNLDKQGDTPMMPAGKQRASMSTPRRKSRGHIRALDFGSTPPKQLSVCGDSSTKVPTTSTPYDVPGKFGAIGSLRPPVPLKMARKELSQCLGGAPPGIPLPDLSTTCIATRSPPPRLSGAWNKVGVDLIFGCATSPTTSPAPDAVSPISQGSHESLSEAAKENQEGSKDGTKSPSKGESPTASKSKSSTWDAELRAQLGATQTAPKMTRAQLRAIHRVERLKKKAEAQKAAEEAKRNKLLLKNAKKAARAKSRSRKKGGCVEADGKQPVKEKGQKKSLEKAEAALMQVKSSSSIGEHLPVLLDESAGEEDVDTLEKGKLNASSDDGAGEQLKVGEKRKRSSKGEGSVKKKIAIETRTDELAPPHATHETVTSPEKTWVVQQSPGSWANKRSLHGITPGQSMDPERTKFPSGIGAARRCLDLHETPRKPDPSDVSERVTQSSASTSKRSPAGDRATLTVVDTPLFPPTPGVSGIGTPCGLDSSEAIETFPTYFKPREKGGSAGKEKQVEVSAEEGVDSSATLQVSQECGSVDKIHGEGESDVVCTEEGDEAAQIDFERNPSEGSAAKRTSKNAKKKAKPRKPAAKKTAPKGKSQAIPKKEIPKVVELEENELENVTEDSEEEVLPTRVLRPRRKTSYLTESPIKETKKDGASNKEFKGSGKKKPAPKKKKKPPSPEYVPEPCDIVPEEDIVEGLVYKPLAPEVVKTQSHEAELLVKQIRLKLSPLMSKQVEVEEEEDEVDSPLNVSGPTGKIYQKVEQQVVVDSAPDKRLSKGTNSSASSHSSSSSSSESSSCDSSSEDEADHDEATPAESGVKSSSEVVVKMDESIKNADKEPINKVAGSENVVGGSHFEKGDVAKPQSSTLQSENIDKSDGKILSIVQGKKGNDKEVTGSSGVRSESQKLSQFQKSNLLEKNDLNKRINFLSEQKKRRDNLEKILFGREHNDEEPVAVENESTILPVTDHSLSTELEQKKQRTLERLKGGKAAQSSNYSERDGLNLSRSPPQPVRKSPAAVNSTVQSLLSPQKKIPQRSPRKSTPIKETSKIISIFDVEEDEDCQDDCPELRLSEGDDFEFGSPEKVLISPRKFELLNTLEDKMALLHGDITSPVLKKTARMSCTPVASRSTERSPRKDLLKQLRDEANTVGGSNPNNGPKKTGKECPPAREPEAIPSTSRAAELRHKADERKYLSMMQSVPLPTRTSGVTIRKNYSEKLRRSLRTNQLEAANENTLRNDECAQNVEESLLDDENRAIEGENSEKMVSEEKSKCHRSSPRKSKEHGALLVSPDQNVSANVKASQKDKSKDSRRSVDALEPQTEVGSVKPNDKKLPERKSTADTPLICLSPLDDGEGSTKQVKKHQKKRVDGAIEVDRSKDKPSRSKKKSGHAQDSTSKDGTNWVPDLNEDELTRDGFTASTLIEGSDGQSPTVDSEVPSKKIPKVNKNNMPREKEDKQRKEIVDLTDCSKEMKEAGLLPDTISTCDISLHTSPGKNEAVNKTASSSSRATTQQSPEDSTILDVEEVQKQLLEGAKRQLNYTPKETSERSSKNTSKPAQIRPPNSGERESQTPMEVPSAEVDSSTTNVQALPVKAAEKCDQIHSAIVGKENAMLDHSFKGKEGCVKERDLAVSPQGTNRSNTSEAPSTSGSLSDNSDNVNAPMPAPSQGPAEEVANNVSWSGSTDMSFSSNEAYITVVYDEDNPSASTSSVLMSQLGPPLSPSAPELEGLTVELDGEIVTITKSEYIELFSYSPKEIAPISRGVRGKVISTIFSTSKKSKIDDKQKMVAKKKDDDSDRNHSSKGVTGDKKRKHAYGSEPGKSEMLTKSSKSSRRKDKEVPKKSLSVVDKDMDKEMESIQRVVDACNDISNDDNTVDDDSLMTYAAIGSIVPEENHNKEDEGSRKFLPLKKRRTTTEDTPVKSQADGDVVNSNPGMFFPLNVMEIEDFLSKVHGDGS